MKVLASVLTLLTVSVAQASGRTQPDEGYVRTADGVRLFYKVVGGGAETLVAVHGGPGNTLESILPDLEPLAKNRRVIYYDQRGGGRSDLIRDKGKLRDPIPVESSEAWARGFPEARLLLVEGSGHLSHVEQPELFFGAVETFLKGGWPPAAKNLKVPAVKK